MEKNEGKREYAKKKKKKQGEKLELGGCKRVPKILRLSCTES